MSGTPRVGDSIPTAVAKAAALAEWPLGKEVEPGIRRDSRATGTEVIGGRGRRWTRLATWLAIRLVTPSVTIPRSAPRLARRLPDTESSPAMPIHSLEWSARSVSRGMTASMTGLRVCATASNTETSNASTSRAICRSRPLVLQSIDRSMPYAVPARHAGRSPQPVVTT